jgi:outer membrane protein assembly complex protein YaeT
LLLVASLLSFTLPVEGALAQARSEGLIIRKLAFSGNRAFEDIVLAAAIATTGSSWFASSSLVRWVGLGAKRRLNERDLRTDVLRLEVFYHSRGFLEAKVDTTVIRTQRDAHITFRIVEGPPVLLRNFAIRGLDSMPRPAKLTDDLPLRLGKPFDRTLLVATADTLVSRLQDRGYPGAQVLLERREVHREGRVADVSMLVEPGTRSVIGEIHVTGTNAVDSSFVRSLLATEPGRTFSARDLAESQRNLYRTGLFRFATVGLDTAHFVASSGIVPLTITVSEGPLHRARSAVGYGTNDCFRAGLGWTARNAFGKGRMFDASAQVSKLGVGDPTRLDALLNSICSALKEDSIGSARVNYNFTMSFRRPVFLSPANTLTLALIAERRSEFAVYMREEAGGSLTLNRETQSQVPISIAYRLAYGFTEASPVSFCAYFNVCTEADINQLSEPRLSGTLSIGVQRPRANHPLDPTRGSLLAAEMTISSRLLGSSELEQFARLSGDASLYRSFGSAVLALRLWAGIIVAPQLALNGGAGNFVPPEHRFYAGGPNDVRGYSRNELGPLDYVIAESEVTLDASGAAVYPDDQIRTVATGGNTLVVANVELRVPAPIFPSRVRLAVFVDGGTVWERGGGSESGPAFRVTPGLGVRFATPLGPARIDVAYNPYDLPAGKLYLERSSGQVDLITEHYQPAPKPGREWAVQLAIGHAF